MLSFAVTAYHEKQRGNFQWIRECITPASQSPLIDEIVIVNDGTPDFSELTAALADVPKVSLYQNPERLHVFANKVESVRRATDEWVLLCDSDNIMGNDYLRQIEQLWPWQSDIWYCASWAKPAFDYRAFIGCWSVADIPSLVGRPQFWCFVNTGNQFVHRKTFLSLFDHYQRRYDLQQPNYFNATNREDEKWFLAYGAQDSFFLMKTWFLAGNKVHCDAELQYDHRIDAGNRSNYNRGPDEKVHLAPIYYMELRDAALNEGPHQYTVIDKDRYAREDGVIVRVNWTTGEITTN